MKYGTCVVRTTYIYLHSFRDTTFTVYVTACDLVRGIMLGLVDSPVVDGCEQ